MSGSGGPGSGAGSGITSGLSGSWGTGAGRGGSGAGAGGASGDPGCGGGAGSGRGGPGCSSRGECIHEPVPMASGSKPSEPPGQSLRQRLDERAGGEARDGPVGGHRAGAPVVAAQDSLQVDRDRLGSEREREPRDEGGD